MRLSAALQDCDCAKGAVLPAVQAAQAPEQAAVERPAWSPKVPAGHSKHCWARLMDENVPGAHGVHGSSPVDEKLPGMHTALAVGVAEEVGEVEADCVWEACGEIVAEIEAVADELADGEDVAEAESIEAQ